MTVPSSVQSYLAEPQVDDAPARVWRDWLLVGASTVGAVLEATLRRDDEWLTVAPIWRWGALVVFLVTVPVALLIRRTHPLSACALGFGATVAFGVLAAVVEGEFGGLISTAVILVCLYSLFRWGSGRDGLFGLLLAVAAGVVGTITDPSATVGDWIGGFIVLSIPIELGLIVRFQRGARARAISEAKALEREDLARELHDTVAHHVSAIAVQAQAGRALAATDPDRALAVLAVIEDAASRTLTEMRAMVGTLRNGAEADLAPQPGLHDLHQLAGQAAGEIPVQVSIDDIDGTVGIAAESALYRIARESITNAVRHARDATSITVDVVCSADVITLTVADDGAPAHERRGSAGSNGSGYGLLGMAERAQMLGGSFHAGPRPGNGWQVVATLPRAGSPS